jgi:hypothetical protein
MPRNNCFWYGYTGTPIIQRLSRILSGAPKGTNKTSRKLREFNSYKYWKFFHLGSFVDPLVARGVTSLLIRYYNTSVHGLNTKPNAKALNESETGYYDVFRQLIHAFDLSPGSFEIDMNEHLATSKGVDGYRQLVDMSQLKNSNHINRIPVQGTLIDNKSGPENESPPTINAMVRPIHANPYDLVDHLFSIIDEKDFGSEKQKIGFYEMMDEELETRKP